MFEWALLFVAIVGAAFVLWFLVSRKDRENPETVIDDPRVGTKGGGGGGPQQPL